VKTTVRVEGLSELEASLGELTKATARNALRAVLTKAGEPIAEAMRRYAPDDPATTGLDLRKSIAVSPKLRNPVGKAEFAAVMRGGGSKSEAVAAMRDARRAGSRSFAEVYVGPGKGGAHGVLQEFGTVHHRPQPFARPAWDENKGKALDIIRTETAGEIDKRVQRARRKALRKLQKAAGG